MAANNSAGQDSGHVFCLEGIVACSEISTHITNVLIPPAEQQRLHLQYFWRRRPGIESGMLSSAGQRAFSQVTVAGSFFIPCIASPLSLYIYMPSVKTLRQGVISYVRVMNLQQRKMRYLRTSVDIFSLHLKG